MSEVALPLKLRAHARESGGKLQREVHLKDDIIIENKNIVIIINDNIANKDTAFLHSPGKPRVTYASRPYSRNRQRSLRPCRQRPLGRIAERARPVGE